ncbi:MAG: RNA-directed DNA polymerase [Gomphosphaeria aponina SAG 52.96 = DSM 107014]|uniref:RNA-directed DNA polymerase n=1 Tax=Gomphosphaeria aponina SAG 52.96 = DSM 107014 TaxID=1521640 RepID=A0A941GSM4_9CHRO|nr:RNA-directed DNA polymerase [Gomphosphaeria aponina SAG 52.96 = DSM 107014]
MKRYGNLWEQITDFSNLISAAQKAQKGKRFRDNVLAFNYNLEQEIFKLQTELKEKTYLPGKYKTFTVYEPKPRQISAAPYKDRVVHHGLCNVIVPLIEPKFIADCYANRIGYGTHRALRRFTQFARSSKYILQCDIRKYFPSIDHEILKTLVRRKIKCQHTLWLIHQIIDGSNPQEEIILHFPGDDLLSPLARRRGLPIGNLTSQFLANFYLNDFDHFVKEQLKSRKYLRYVDDFALFSDDLAFLEAARSEIVKYLATLRLQLHPVKSQLFATKEGANFLGFRVLPNCLRVRQENLRRGRRRTRRLILRSREGKIPCFHVCQSLQSWFAHLKQGDTWHLRQKIFQSLNFNASINQG